MDKVNSRIAQVYGYAVCLICVVVVLVSAKSVIDAAFDYANPLGSNMAFGRFGPVSSFEGYRIAAREMRVHEPDGSTSPAAQMSDADLRTQYNEERAVMESTARLRALRSLVSGSILLALAAGMFLFHWRWMRRIDTGAPAA